jgi:AcrR family transcriptional regulator
LSIAGSREDEPRRRLTAAARRELIVAAAAALFAERGYRGASIGEIARRSGVTPPVVYEHFDSKSDLYRELLEIHFAGLREVWRKHFPGEAPPAERVARSLDAWFAYVESHPFAARVLFRDGGSDPEIASIHRQVAERSRAEVMQLFATEQGAESVAGPLTEAGLEMAWVVLRGVLQGLALWWSEHPEVPRDAVVATAMNTLWIGFERAQRGEGYGEGRTIARR